MNKFIYMADGLFVHKTEDGYAVLNQMGFILKTAKTLKTCDNYVQQQLKENRASERQEIEKIN